MAFISNGVFDAALAVVNTAIRIDICNVEPTSNTQAQGSASLGSNTIAIGAAQAGDVTGRKVVIPAVSGASVTANGTASHWALCNSTALVATGSLASTQVVTSGNQFSLGTFDITFPAAVNA